MANAKKCDRCGKFYDFYYSDHDQSNAISSTRMFGGSRYIVDDYDLCPECMNEIMRWIKDKYLVVVDISMVAGSEENNNEKSRN